MQERLIKQMSKIQDQFTALEKLEEFQHSNKSEEAAPRLMFLTWPASKFGLYRELVGLLIDLLITIVIQGCYTKNLSL